MNGSQVAFVHTLFAIGAFGTALVLGCYLHYHKIVNNEASPLSLYGFVLVTLPLELMPDLSCEFLRPLVVWISPGVVPLSQRNNVGPTSRSYFLTGSLSSHHFYYRGDYYPERPIFQILIAFNSGPRLLLVYLTYVFQIHFSAKTSTTASKFVAICGFLRTISCGGWVYITSSDNHFWHDVMMIT